MSHDNGNRVRVPPGNEVTLQEKARVLDLLLAHFGDIGELETLMASTLEHAADTVDVNLLRTLLTLGAPANTTCSTGDSILHKVASIGSQPGVLALLGRGAVVDRPGLDGRTALHWAARNDHALAAAALLEAGADLNVRPDDDKTALDLAAYSGSVSVVETLIRYGADVNAARPGGFQLTVLHTAAMGDHDGGTLRVLVENGANVDALNTHGATPLHLAVLAGARRLVTALCALGANRDILDALGHVPLHIGIAWKRYSAVEALLDADADIELRATDDDEFSPLDMAVWHGDEKFVKMLLERGANVNAADTRGRTVLHKAARYDKNLMIELLVAAGANVRAQDTCRQTPLHCAAWELKDNAARVLLRHGASANAPDDRGQSPLHVAASVCWNNNSLSFIQSLLEWDADATAVCGLNFTPVSWLGVLAPPQPAVAVGGGLPNNNLVRNVLYRAPAERAEKYWRRRGFLVMCRALPDISRPKFLESAGRGSRRAGGMETRRSKKARLKGGAGDIAGIVGGGGIAHQGAQESTSVSDDATEGLTARVVGMDDELFRHVMTFL